MSTKIIITQKTIKDFIYIVDETNFFHEIVSNQFSFLASWGLYTVNIYRYKAIGAKATSSVILYTCKCISPCLEIL